MKQKIQQTYIRVRIAIIKNYDNSNTNAATIFLEVIIAKNGAAYSNNCWSIYSILRTLVPPFLPPPSPKKKTRNKNNDRKLDFSVGKEKRDAWWISTSQANSKVFVLIWNDQLREIEREREIRNMNSAWIDWFMNQTQINTNIAVRPSLCQFVFFCWNFFFQLFSLSFSIVFIQPKSTSFSLIYDFKVLFCSERERATEKRREREREIECNHFNWNRFHCSRNKTKQKMGEKW